MHENPQSNQMKQFPVYQHISTRFRRPHLPFSHVMPVHNDELELGHLDDISFGNIIAEQPIANCRGLPQGDPWSPAVLALCLLLPLRQQKRQVAGADALLFLDDRTIVAQDVPTLKAAERCWERLGEVSRMETQRAKTQYWARTPQAYVEFQREGIQPQFQVQILGVTCGLKGRSMSSEEKDKAEKCKRLASRIAVLPKSLRFKASLCSLILAPIFTWGVFLGGHYPNVKFCKNLKTIFFQAVKGFDSHDTQTSRELFQVFCLGHCSDLIFYATQRLMKALSKWRSANRDVTIPEDSSVISLVSKAMTSLGAAVQETGQFRFNTTVWSLDTPVGWMDRIAHLFRAHWRKQKLQLWLDSQRNDAVIARNIPLVFTDKLVDSLHKVSRDLQGHEISVASGGITTDAKYNTREFCNFCQQNQCPTTEHVLWTCVCFSDLRLVCRPACILTGRLGWGPKGFSLPVLRQMAQIRAQATKLYRAAARIEGGRGEGPLPLRTDDLRPLRGRAAGCCRARRCSFDFAGHLDDIKRELASSDSCRMMRSEHILGVNLKYMIKWNIGSKTTMDA